MGENVRKLRNDKRKREKAKELGLIKPKGERVLCAQNKMCERSCGCGWIQWEAKRVAAE